MCHLVRNVLKIEDLAHNRSTWLDRVATTAADWRLPKVSNRVQ